ncbi:flavin-containing monooxygenase [Rhodococcus opacus]|uniref:flavin-containing monooxygenase n=1 Tax=Rhodococcus opacus TaxID=37919 RepID=UPI0024743CC0|nr:NAD(P)/FAD-dependent oxidoreductase [Rhodococcus opacus]MDH6291327.1 cation diffusion facilitator CzcD-associated flavoprotein CzcO [Rhodococcus opacus]
MHTLKDDADRLDHDVIVVGAGFGGMAVLNRLRNDGLRVQAFEAGDEVGGTWYWNTYPGARVDIESVEYSYPFSDLQQEWTWPEKYSSQRDVLRYLTWVADRLDLRRSIEFGTKVTRATYSDDDTWTVDIEGSTGETRTVTCRYFVLATGFLSVPHLPNIAGLQDFRGTFAHTARWPHEEVDMHSKRVGVIGTAASGIQVIQAVAPQAAKLSVFQRTANWSFPLRNTPMTEEYESWVKENYEEIRNHEYTSRGAGAVLVDNQIHVSEGRSALDLADDERSADFDHKWQAGGPHLSRSFPDIITNIEANNHLRNFWSARIAEIVDDPDTARKLTPTHPPLSRRPPGNSGYYEVFNRSNVDLIDIKADPIERVTETGVRLRSGAEIELDVLVLATGFDAGGGAAMQIDLRGRDGRRIQDHWVDGVRTNLGLAVHGFPNLLLVNGPQSPAVHFSPPLLSSYQADLMSRLIRTSADHNVGIEPSLESENDWVEKVRARYEMTLIPQTDSWWMGANIPGKPRRPIAWPGGFVTYRDFAEQWFAEFESRTSQAAAIRT